MFGSVGAPELIIIGLLVLLLFGAGRVAGLGRDLGLSMREFRKAMKDDDVAPEASAPVLPGADGPGEVTAPPTDRTPLIF
jgi:sec-independent protein translocase protein TatA